MRTSLIVLLALAMVVAAVSFASAAMTPMSDSSLSAITAGGPGGGGGQGGSDDFEVKLEVEDQSQQYAVALNLINAIGPAQAGNNILVLNSSAGKVELENACVMQAVMNINDVECSPCEFDDASWKVEIEDQSQQYAKALNLINSGGVAQAGNNILIVNSSADKAEIENSCIAQVVVNSSTQASNDWGWPVW